MAEEEKDVQEESGGKKKSKLKLIIIILILLLILGGGGAAGYFFFIKGSDDAVAEGGKADKTKKVAKTSEIGPLYSFDAFIVNLADPGGNRYLKVSMQVELSDEKLAEELEKRKPQVRDIILTVLSSKTYAEISTAQGKLALKQEIIRRVNLILTTGNIVNLYFMEFVAQ
jgi:flagellar FliL protein